MKRLVTVLASVLLPSLAVASTWDIDPVHSSAQFSVKHMTVTNVRGEFGKVKGVVNLDDKDPTKSTVEASVDTSTINTREPKRDEHLKSADFFDVAKYPQITFKSKKIAKAGPNKFKITGDLTIRDVTKEVVLDTETGSAEVKDGYGNIKRGLSATTKINRKDYGLKWNQILEGGSLLVGEEVAITLDVQLTKRKEGGAGAPGQK